MGWTHGRCQSNLSLAPGREWDAVEKAQDLDVDVLVCVPFAHPGVVSPGTNHTGSLSLVSLSVIGDSNMLLLGSW